MKRTDFILVWSNEDIVYCNSEMCDKIYEKVRFMPNLHCPTSSISICINSKTFRNDKDIIVATIKECKGKEMLDCDKDCDTCITMLLIKEYNEDYPCEDFFNKNM